MTQSLIESIGAALLCFGSAFVLVALSSGLRYLSQSAFSAELMARLNSEEPKAAKARRLGNWFRGGCIAALCATIPLFTLGGWRVYSGLRNQALELYGIDQNEAEGEVVCPANNTSGRYF